MLQAPKDRSLRYFVCRKLIQDRLGPEWLGDDPFLGFLEPIGREVMGREPQAEALSAGQPVTGQREILR